MRDGIEARVRDVPDFTRKLRRVPLGLDHPVWVRDTQFDIERHVHRLALPTPGGYAELTELAGHLAGLPLDRSRPLWEMWVIEGYVDDDGRDLIAVFQKMHHATVDGVSGANLISHLCSLEPDAEPLGAQQEKKAWPHEPGRGELLGRALVTSTTRPFTTVGLLAPTVKGVVGTIGRAREGTAMAAPLTAPRTSFNGTITGHRAIALAQMDLDTIKEVKAATGTTVNDVVLAVAGGALRSYLEDRDELPDSSLLATVPVSVRSESSAPAPTRSRRSSRGSAPTSRTRWSGSRTWRPPTATPRTTTRRSAPTRCRTGPSSRRRAPSASRSARTPPPPGREAPGGAQPGDLQRARVRRCRSTSWAPGSRRCTRSARSSTAPASTSPSCPTTAGSASA